MSCLLLHDGVQLVGEVGQLDDVGVGAHRHPAVEQFSEFLNQYLFHFVGHLVVVDAVKGMDVVVVRVVAVVGNSPELAHPIDVTYVEEGLCC